MASHGHFQGHQFPTANYFSTRPVLSYLAVATATWEHWKLFLLRDFDLEFYQYHMRTYEEIIPTVLSVLKLSMHPEAPKF